MGRKVFDVASPVISTIAPIVSTAFPELAPVLMPIHAANTALKLGDVNGLIDSGKKMLGLGANQYDC